MLERIMSFISEYLEDLFIVIGVLLVVSATYIFYGLPQSMYVLGVFFILWGVVGIIFYRGKG